MTIDGEDMLPSTEQLDALYITPGLPVKDVVTGADVLLQKGGTEALDGEAILVIVGSTGVFDTAVMFQGS